MGRRDRRYRDGSMKTSTTPPFRTNPSAIARYFFHDCERFLYYSAADPKRRRREGIPEPAFDHSPIVKAILASGYRWEEEVVRELLRDRVVVAAGDGPLHTRRLPLERTLGGLRREPVGRFLYQPTLAPPRRFYDAFGIDPKLVTVSDNHPDLIAILPDAAGGRLFRVVDVKRGDSLKLTHRVQVLLYALELQSLIEAEGIPSARVDLEHGAVWLGKRPEPEVFGLGDFRPHLEKFLREDLGRILAASAQEARWHLYPRCEWCEFFDHCREEMRQGDDLSRLERLTTHGKRHLREEAGVETLAELGQFLQRPEADGILDRCASLAGQRHRLTVRVMALETGTAQLYEASSPDLPRGENVGLFLTLQREPLGQAVYLAGFLVTAREEVRRLILPEPDGADRNGGKSKPEPLVWVAAAPEEVPAVRRQFIENLYEVLGRLHGYNAGQENWREQLSLQAYVHTEEERRLLFHMLLEALGEPDLADKAMTLMFHFQGPELMRADQHPGSEVAYPVVVLQNAVGRLLALPVEVSYTLPEMLEALGSSFPYHRKDFFHFPLGHGLRAEAIHAAWYQGKSENVAETRRQARLYLLALQALLRAVRERAADLLVAWPPKFKLPTGAGIRDRLLSRLAFFVRYESLVRCLAVREARAEARPTQVLLGQVIELRARDPYTMEVVGSLVLEPEAGGFPAWLLVRDSAEGRRAQIEYADYWYRSKAHGGPDQPHRAVVGVREVETTADGAAVLRLTYARPFKENKPTAGERFLLYERFTDFTTDGVVKFLENLDRAGADFFRQFLANPEGGAAACPLSRKVAAAADKLAAGCAFTPSQADAFAAIRRQRVTVVWGPPGTGKTHFLAQAILILAAAHARAGLSFRVLATASTHAAIENLLRKIAELAESMANQSRRSGRSGKQADSEMTVPRIGKAKYWQGAAASVGVVAEADLGEWLRDGEWAVLGATVFSCLKRPEEVRGFDLVVIDEASQTRVPEAAVPISLMAEAGRLVLAGDHLQLPPIVAGVYPDTPAGEPLLHRSIFEAIWPREGEESQIVRPLLENFRMNDVLTSFAAELLYGPGYRPVDETVARRRLAFKRGRNLDPLVEACLDPEYPLVLVILDGVRAAQANPVEADLVAQLVAALRDGLCAAEDGPYANDAAFFRHGVFVVSPHHAQIRAIQRELAGRRQWETTPFVGTVDKMQGQEADAVIVSYGVADPEFALKEAEFIYGLNRLNVALTRARVKSVVCLPRPLLEATPRILDVEAAAAGLAFMRRLVAAAKCAGEETVFEGDEIEARLLRVRQPLI